MADFVAVIRRTVDGLSDNVPEMRAKVYDKARGAVRRQLESMKPRPSDEMIERQMIKLEAAIGEVESDHAEALPPLEDHPVEVPYDVVEAHDYVPAAEEPVVVEPEAEAQPVESAEDTRDQPVEDLPPAYEEPVYPQESSPAASEAIEAPEPEVIERDEDYRRDLEEPDAFVQRETEPEHELEPEPTPEPEPEPLPELEPVPEPEVRPIYATEQEEYRPDVAAHQEAAHDEEPQHSDPVFHDEAPAVDPILEQAEQDADEPRPDDYKPGLLKTSEWELPEWSDPTPAAAHSETVWTEAAEPVVHADDIPDLTGYEPVETVTPVSHSADDPQNAAGEPSHSWAWDDNDPFTQTAPATEPQSSEPAISDWSWPVEKPAAVEPEAQKPSAADWNDVDELLGHGAAPAAGAAASLQAGRGAAAAQVPDDEMEVPSRPVSYRVEPKRSSFNGKAIGLVVVLLLLLGGGGYAYWQNQTAVNSWVSGMVTSVTAQLPGQAPADVSVPAENDAKDLPATPDANNTQTQTPPTQNTDVAALDTTSKFTQRLQQDGTEIDQGPAVAPAGDNTTEEGKSVAAQTEAGRPPESAAQATTTPTGQTAAETQTAQPVPGQQAAADPATQEIPAGAQKMFLYEERLGQSAPTAIEGNVVWSLKEESPGGDAKPEPVIQAQINVPERGLTALMTIKRNADSSLPASHVIEFVFSLPENFEGGSIDSVQRVAMKRNEQDRGDALIAVPAKITEDFHMIALNDFPEAVATNTDLLRSRSWIDIPLTYRNGRRALLTLEKGPAGTDAFTKAMQAWSLIARPNPAGQ